MSKSFIQLREGIKSFKVARDLADVEADGWVNPCSLISHDDPWLNKYLHPNESIKGETIQSTT